MPFLRCKNCVVRACCSEVCEEFKEYHRKKYNITIGNISLNQAITAFGGIKKIELNMGKWHLSTAGKDDTLFRLKQIGGQYDKT